MGYSPEGHTESDMTKALGMHAGDDAHHLPGLLELMTVYALPLAPHRPSPSSLGASPFPRRSW